MTVTNATQREFLARAICQYPEYLLLCTCLIGFSLMLPGALFVPGTGASYRFFFNCWPLLFLLFIFWRG